MNVITSLASTHTSSQCHNNNIVLVVDSSSSSSFDHNNNNHHKNKTAIIMMNDSASFLFFVCKVAIVCVVFWNHFVPVKGFGVTSDSITTRCSFHRSPSTFATTSFRQRQPLILAAASGSGRGMGMGSSATSTKKNKNNKRKNGGNNNQKATTTTTTTTTSPFDVSASLIRLEKKYDQLMLNAAKELQKEAEQEAAAAEEEEESIWDTPIVTTSAGTATAMMTSEYVIAARAAPATNNNKSSPKLTAIPDWVPIAQLCLKRPESEYQDGASDVMVQTAISAYCRELSHVAAFGAPVFSTIARNQLQYSVETVESFRKYVYEEVVEGKSKQNKDETMTKAEARETLGLANDNTNPETFKADLKQKYRQLSFELHPDRFEGTPEECEQATEQFARVKLAYETLSSGVRGQDGISWYESLGGRARTGFVGPINLLPLAAAQEHMTRHQAEGAIIGLDPTLVQSFVARHLRSE